MYLATIIKNMLQTVSISHKYKGTQRFNFPDIICNPKETMLVLGSSGVGKTTLLHILAGILKPLSGDVLIHDKSLYKLSGNQLDKYRGQNIGLVFQKPHFVQSITAEENLMLSQKMAGQNIDKTFVNQLLDKLNISNRKASKTYLMSQGEQQRLSIARAIINNPKVILADEPTSALDDENCDQVISLLQSQAEEVNASLIIVTHDNRLKKIFTNITELN